MLRAAVAPPIRIAAVPVARETARPRVPDGARVLLAQEHVSQQRVLGIAIALAVVRQAYPVLAFAHCRSAYGTRVGERPGDSDDALVRTPAPMRRVAAEPLHLLHDALGHDAGCMHKDRVVGHEEQELKRPKGADDGCGVCARHLAAGDIGTRKQLAQRPAELLVEVRINPAGYAEVQDAEDVSTLRAGQDAPVRILLAGVAMELNKAPCVLVAEKVVLVLGVQIKPAVYVLGVLAQCAVPCTTRLHDDARHELFFQARRRNGGGPKEGDVACRDALAQLRRREVSEQRVRRCGHRRHTPKSSQVKKSRHQPS